MIATFQRSFGSARDDWKSTRKDKKGFDVMVVIDSRRVEASVTESGDHLLVPSNLILSMQETIDK